jgi:hypothetical protein
MKIRVDGIGQHEMHEYDVMYGESAYGNGDGCGHGVAMQMKHDGETERPFIRRAYMEPI